MKSSLHLIAPLLIAGQAGLFAQQPPAPGMIAAASTVLAPPPDGAAPAADTSTTTTTTTTTSTPATPPAPKQNTPAKLSPQEVSRIQQQEVIRRQQMVFEANQYLANGQKAELETNYPEARKNYLTAVDAYGSVSRSTASYAKSAEGLTRVDFQLYDSALKAGDTARAKMLIEEILKYNPNNAAAQQKLVAINRALANPNDTSLLGNPAVTPALVQKVNEIQQLFAEAEQYRRTGQWDLATIRLKRILGLDPYNIAATKQLDRINSEKRDYYDHARLETRAERIREVEEKWYEPINNKDLVINPEEAQPTLLRKTNFDLDQKMKSIMISLDFLPGTTIEQATNFLSIESKRLDTIDHKGVNFIIQPEASTTAKTISLTLNNVPLEEALRYVCQLANVKYKVEDYAISIIPFTGRTDDLISRTFIVQPNFVAPPAAAGVIESGTSALLNGGGAGGRPLPPPPGGTPAPGGTDTSADPVRAAMEAKGVKFPPGASAIYNSNTGQLQVLNTADQMELIEELVNAGQAPTLMVKIATKFVEINQEDVNDLTVNAGAGYFNINAGHNMLAAGVSFVPAMPGAAAFSPNGVAQLLSGSGNAASNTFALHGMINAASFQLVINALSQKKSFDLVTEPSVLTKSGEQGVIEAVRVFPYPIAFDPPELVTPPTNNNANAGVVLVQVQPPAVIPTTPTDFKRRNIGVRLVIKPQVTADNKTVDLSLFPEVTDFEGFINYGSEIQVANPTTQPGFDFLGNPVQIPTNLDKFSTLSPNVINQPVFNTRRINTKVLVKDGCTVVLGGLLRDDVQTINDKVPFLGDLPLVGRLFQSKALETTKRNLIIFVTANIYRNDGELLNPPDALQAQAADMLMSRAAVTPPPTTQ